MQNRVRMLTRDPFRTVSLFASFSSALLNILCVARVLASWRSLKWDFDEADVLRVDAVKLVWGLLSLYFAAAATASTIGFVGIARKKLNHVRFFRDYSIADLVFMFVCALAMSYASFSSSSMLQASVCEELGRQPELMRDMAESGLNLENCEYWFERGVIAALGAILVFAIVRVHFVIALSKYYSQLRREQSCGSAGSAKTNEHSLQRIYLLPTPTSSTFPPINYNHHQTDGNNNSSSTADYYYHDEPSASDTILVYAPISLNRLSLEEAKGMHATEAWISPVPPPTPRHGHKHRRHHSHSHAHSGTRPHYHRHRSSASVLSVLSYKDDVEVPLLAVEKAESTV